jgi:DNA-binding transcriptional LysR family regulator
MLDSLETLLVLSELGTMGRAATRLRITQSAVSKRIEALSSALGAPLIERVGRHVRLTPVALALAERTRPLLSELRGALAGEQIAGKGRLALGVAESLLTSWAPAALQRVKQALPDVHLELHAHRSPVALDGVRAGEFALAIVAGTVDAATGLFSDHLLDEEMVIIGLPRPSQQRLAGARAQQQAGRRSRAPTLPRSLAVLSIERRSATFTALTPQLAALRANGFELEVASELESYAAVVQLGRSGFGPALVPWPLARALGVPRADARALPAPGLRRPVSLVGRKSALSRSTVVAFRDALLATVRPADGRV